MITMRCDLQLHAKSGLALVMTQLMLTISLYVMFWNIDSRGMVVGTVTVYVPSAELYRMSSK